MFPVLCSAITSQPPAGAQQPRHKLKQTWSQTVQQQQQQDGGRCLGCLETTLDSFHCEQHRCLCKLSFIDCHPAEIKPGSHVMVQS